MAPIVLAVNRQRPVESVGILDRTLFGADT